MSGRIAIIGAGLSGLSCAQQLIEGGLEVVVFDKGRSPGGRASTRRVEMGGADLDFDHGAQYFTVRDAAVKDRLDAWLQAGVAASWDGRVAVLGAGGEVESYNQRPRYVGTPGMSALCSHLSLGLDVRSEVRVARVERSRESLMLFDDQGAELGQFSTVISTAPPAQTVALLSSVAPAVASRAQSVRMQPCWALMAAFGDRIDVPYDGAFINEGALSWVARTSSKPSRIPQPDRWVFHAAPAWSVPNLELRPDEAAERLLEEAEDSTGVRLPSPIYCRAHRWRYSIAENPLDAGALYDSNSGVGACGDWACGNRVEGAILSGLRMAHMIGRASTDEVPRRQ